MSRPDYTGLAAVILALGITATLVIVTVAAVASAEPVGRDGVALLFTALGAAIAGLAGYLARRRNGAA